MSRLFLCRKLLQLFLGKSTKPAATRAALFYSNRPYARNPDPTGRPYSVPPDPLAVFRGLLLKAGEEGR